MKLSALILLWTLNFISTKYDRLKTIRKSQAKFYVEQQSEMDFLHTESSVGQQHDIQSWSQVTLEQVKSHESHWRQITSQVKSN